jgi:hypothetical protein
MARKSAPKPHTEYHKDGSIWAKGQTIDGVPTGYWEWFRKGGTKMRSGTFEKGQQVGEWTTYDPKGKVYKVTVMKPTDGSCELTINPKANFPPGVSRPALRALEAAGYTGLSQLRTVSDAKLLALHGMGPKALGLIRAALKNTARAKRS